MASPLCFVYPHMMSAPTWHKYMQQMAEKSARKMPFLLVRTEKHTYSGQRKYINLLNGPLLISKREPEQKLFYTFPHHLQHLKMWERPRNYLWLHHLTKIQCSSHTWFIEKILFFVLHFSCNYYNQQHTFCLIWGKQSDAYENRHHTQNKHWCS